MPRPVRIAETPPRFQVSVQSVEALGDEVYRVRLDPHPMPWVPGDCVTLYAPKVDEGRPYSLSGPPDAPFMEFWIRRFPEGVVSRSLVDHSPGDVVEVSPPFGWFRPCEPKDEPKLYVATGTGIAPFLSALSLDKECRPRVLWGMRTPLPVPDILQAHDLQRCISRGTSSREGCKRVTDVLRECDLGAGGHVYLCGLDAMIEEASSLLKERGVPDSRRHTECFFTSPSSSS